MHIDCVPKFKGKTNTTWIPNFIFVKIFSSHLDFNPGPLRQTTSILVNSALLSFFTSNLNYSLNLIQSDLYKSNQGTIPYSFLHRRTNLQLQTNALLHVLTNKEFGQNVQKLHTKVDIG